MRIELTEEDFKEIIELICNAKLDGELLVKLLKQAASWGEAELIN